MPMTNWINEAKNFDDQYKDKGTLSWLPFFASYVKNDLQFRQELVRNFLGDVKGQRVLDIGCGVGRLAHILAKEGAYVVGFDISGEAIGLATQYAEEQGLSSRCEFHVCDITKEDVSTEADLWVALGVWQYLPDPETPLSKLAHIPRFITDVPVNSHWINPLRKIYRTGMKGITFKAYSLREAYALFNNCGISGVHVDSSNPTIYLVSRRARD